MSDIDPSNADTKREVSDEYGRVLDAALGPVLEAYYSLRINAAATARARSQSVLSLLSLLLGALVGIFSVVLNQPFHVRLLGLLTISLWLLASALYVWSTSPPDPENLVDGSDSGREAITTREDLVDVVVEISKKEAAGARKRQKKADLVAASALALTIFSISFPLLFDPTEKSGEITLFFTTEGGEAVSEVCGEEINQISGTANSKDVGKDFIKIRVSEDKCGPGLSSLQVPSENVLAMRWNNE